MAPGSVGVGATEVSGFNKILLSIPPRVEVGISGLGE